VNYEVGEERHELHPGDCLYADGTQKHRVLCRGKTPAKILIIFAGRT